jgi:rhodanese-related sulfurtransferase
MKYKYPAIFLSIGLLTVIILSGCTNMEPPAATSTIVQTQPPVSQPVQTTVPPATKPPTSSQSPANPAPAPTEPAPSLTPVPIISVPDAYALVQKNRSNADFVILDVRTADEFNSGHMENAVNIDYYSADFPVNVGKLDKNKQYLVYCRTGVRSAGATRIMIDLGFNNVQSMLGGLSTWITAGYPVVSFGG